MKKSISLSDCSEAILTGATNKVLSSSKTEEFTRPIHLVRGQDLSPQGEVLASNLATGYVKSETSVQRYLLQVGDVVLLARGSDMRAALVTEELANLNVLPSANFIIIRPSSLLKGEVIVAYLNSAKGISLLQQNSKVVSLPTVSRSDVSNLQISVPTMEEQSQIAELFHARNRAHRATLALAKQQFTVSTLQIEKFF